MTSLTVVCMSLLLTLSVREPTHVATSLAASNLQLESWVLREVSYLGTRRFAR